MRQKYHICRIHYQKNPGKLRTRRISFFWHCHCLIENRNTKKTLVNKRDNAMVLDLIQYIYKHRNAKDTLEGIIQWWISNEPRFKWRKEEVQATIDFLVSKGWLVIRYNQVSPQKIYAVNKERVEEMEAFLARYKDWEKKRQPIKTKRVCIARTLVPRWRGFKSGVQSTRWLNSWVKVLPWQLPHLYRHLKRNTGNGWNKWGASSETCGRRLTKCPVTRGHFILLTACDYEITSHNLSVFPRYSLQPLQILAKKGYCVIQQKPTAVLLTVPCFIVLYSKTALCSYPGHG